MQEIKNEVVNCMDLITECFKPTTTARWEEFKVFFEFCAPNYIRVYFAATSGKVRGYNNGKGPILVATNEYPVFVKVPFDRIGYLVEKFQNHYNCLIINTIFEKNKDYVYFITSSKIENPNAIK